jgi:hypothetical protein
MEVSYTFSCLTWYGWRLQRGSAPDQVDRSMLTLGDVTALILLD